MNIREREATDLGSVRTLLEAEGLPVTGLDRSRGWVAEEHGEVVSHIAIEETNDAVVLRSLVTASAFQGRGLGRQLMDVAEAEARNRATLLRTKTIGPWALRRGYTSASGDQIPASVKSTSEFEGSLCSGYPVYIKLPAAIEIDQAKAMGAG